MKRILTALLTIALLTGLFGLYAVAESLDQYFLARFSASPAVYTGPSEGYYRVGKAQYGKGGQARIFGREGNWILIGYETSRGNYRIGYIPYSNASKMTTSGSGYIRTLYFENRSVQVRYTCELTDDPVICHERFYTVNGGTSVTYLASYEKWAYVELYMTNENRKARGFIPMDAVYSDIGKETVHVPYPNPSNSEGVWAVASQKLATRSGPSTQYTDTGTYFLANQSVLVLSKHYDSRNGIWWVKYRIEDGRNYRYLWTGVKRFYDQDWLLSQLPVE